MIKEENARPYFGKTANGPAILIATQVIEAGLDLTCDHLHTEICPLIRLFSVRAVAPVFRAIADLFTSMMHLTTGLTKKTTSTQHARFSPASQPNLRRNLPGAG